jgi:hypothetical protein
VARQRQIGLVHKIQTLSGNFTKPEYVSVRQVIMDTAVIQANNKVTTTP